MSNQDKVNVCSAIFNKGFYVCFYDKPRYKVSIYRTIGPLILVIMCLMA